MSGYTGSNKWQLDSKTEKVPSLSPGQGPATCYYQSNHLKVETIPLSALPKDTTRTCGPISTLTLLNAERQAGKL